jgi:hypothetical protein
MEMCGDLGAERRKHRAHAEPVTKSADRHVTLGQLAGKQRAYRQKTGIDRPKPARRR